MISLKTVQILNNSGSMDNSFALNKSPIENIQKC